MSQDPERTDPPETISLPLWAGPTAWLVAFMGLYAADRLGPSSQLVVWPIAGFIVAFAATVAVLLLNAVAASQLGSSRRVMAIGIGAACVAVLAAVIDLPAALASAAGGLGLLVATTWAGAALGRQIAHRSYLWPLVIVAVAADIWSVTSPDGPTHELVARLEAAPMTLINPLMLSPPVPGIGVTPVLGAGDLVFSALLVGAVYHLGLSPRRALIGLVIGFALCLAALLIFLAPLPALPFIGVSAAASLGRAIRPKSREAWMGVLVAAGFVGAIAIRAIVDS